MNGRMPFDELRSSPMWELWMDYYATMQDITMPGAEMDALLGFFGGATAALVLEEQGRSREQIRADIHDFTKALDRYIRNVKRKANSQ